jgi:hypothetical protein
MDADWKLILVIHNYLTQGSTEEEALIFQLAREFWIKLDDDYYWLLVWDAEERQIIDCLQEAVGRPRQVVHASKLAGC